MLRPFARKLFGVVFVAALAGACSSRSRPRPIADAGKDVSAVSSGDARVDGPGAGGSGHSGGAPGPGAGGNGTSVGGAGAGGSGDSGGAPGLDAGGEGGGAPPVSTGGRPPRDASVGTAPFDWVGIIGTGQSLSVGWEGPVVTTTQPFHHLKLEDTGPDPKYALEDSPSAGWRAIPLVEPIRKYSAGYPGGPYPNNVWKYDTVYGESPHTAMGNQISTLWNDPGGFDYVTGHIVVGAGGTPIVDLLKGTTSYRAALHETRIFGRLAAAEGKTFGVAAVVLTHGEQDASNPAYGPAVFRLQQDYETDLKAATGQTRDIVMLATQQSSSAGSGNSAVQLWQQGVAHPGRIVVAGPKYQYGAYGLHMNAASYARMGEKYGEVFHRIVNQKEAWKPVQPNRVTRSGAVLTIDFDVPDPPLAWDETLATPHATNHAVWSKGRGFEVKSAAGAELEIASVEIRGDSVVLTLANAPAGGAALTLSYGVYADTDEAYQGGKDAGPHGQLRDSDATVGADAEDIEMNVTNGSKDMTVVVQNSDARRAARDLVTGSGLPEGTIATSASFGRLALSNPWPGASGKATLRFRHDLRNYCVHFEMAVP